LIRLEIVASICIHAHSICCSSIVKAWSLLQRPIVNFKAQHQELITAPMFSSARCPSESGLQRGPPCMKTLCCCRRAPSTSAHYNNGYHSRIWSSIQYKSPNVHPAKGSAIMPVRVRASFQIKLHSDYNVPATKHLHVRFLLPTTIYRQNYWLHRSEDAVVTWQRRLPPGDGHEMRTD